MGFWPSWAPDIYVVQTYMQPRHPLTSNNEFFKKNNFNKRTSGVVSPCCAYTYYVISHCTIVWEGQKGLFPTLQPFGPEDGWNLAGMGLQSNSTLPAWGHMTQVLLTTMFYPLLHTTTQITFSYPAANMGPVATISCTLGKVFVISEPRFLLAVKMWGKETGCSDLPS